MAADGEADQAARAVPRFRLLGPLEVLLGERSLPLGGTKQRVLLAHLVLNVNKPVPADQLIESVWVRDPPRSAAANLQTYVWRLRGRLPKFPDGQGLVTHGTSYALLVPPETVDAHTFRELAEAAARARRAGDAEQALRLLQQAESLWRGDPLEDLPSVPGWEVDVGRLLESRLAVREDRLALQVRLGQHEQAAAELAGLLTEHPYREQLWQQYMLALAGAGRRADALRAYSTARDRLVADLGVEPGPALREAQAAILRGEDAATGGDPAGEIAHAGETAPFPLRQLPADVADFTGRTGYLPDLEAALTAPVGAGAPVVVVLSGAPGTGKSALALHLAHRVRERFPDGQLYADLTATGSSPREPADVLADFLHALGVTGAALPSGLDARAAMFRSRLAGRHVLLLLDDAAAAQQVRPLLPAESVCAVLITSRGRMPELAGARQFDVSPLGADEAEQLLAAIAGADRIAAEPVEAAEIVRFCGYFPLAIRVAGARLAGRQAWSLRALRDRLEGESDRLTELRVGDIGVRSSFELSLRQLPAPAVRAFGLLAMLGARDFPGWVVDPLLERRGTDDVLDMLVDANLIAPAGARASDWPRYRIHDLLRCYAAEVLDAIPEHERRDALIRLLDAQLSLAQRAAAGLPRAFGAIAPPRAGWRLEARLAERLLADPLGWFTAERAALLAGVELATAHGLDELGWQLASAAVPFFDLRGLYEDWQRSHRLALAAVRESGNRFGQAALHRGLGQVHLYRDEYDEAERNMSVAADRYAEVGAEHGTALAIAGLGTVARVRDRPADALAYYRKALTALRAVGDRGEQAQLRNAIGATNVTLGDYAAAAQWLDSALASARELGDAHREARVLTELGTMHRETGHPHESLDCLRRALGMLEALRDERCTAYALLGLGQTLLAAGEPAQAYAVGDRALEVFRRTGNRREEATGLALLRQAHRAERRPRQGNDAAGDPG
ncbi:MAG: tetratricopeptide repeat protein [Pseudonocardiaceae bacterium]|nr:tetratricopeptide repeat protein [Pseudonocardiaceae bacterium]